MIFPSVSRKWHDHFTFSQCIPIFYLAGLMDIKKASTGGANSVEVCVLGHL
jgi:hypothetical protein